MRAVPGIFLGFSDTTNGYAVWDPKNSKLLDGKHCWFDEQEFGAPLPEREVAADGRIYHILKPSVPTAGADGEGVNGHQRQPRQ